MQCTARLDGLAWYVSSHPIYACMFGTFQSYAVAKKSSTIFSTMFLKDTCCEVSEGSLATTARSVCKMAKSIPASVAEEYDSIAVHHSLMNRFAKCQCLPFLHIFGKSVQTATHL